MNKWRNKSRQLMAAYTAFDVACEAYWAHDGTKRSSWLQKNKDLEAQVKERLILLQAAEEVEAEQPGALHGRRLCVTEATRAPADDDALRAAITASIVAAHGATESDEVGSDPIQPIRRPI